MFPASEPGDPPGLTKLVDAARKSWERFERAKAIETLEEAMRFATDAGLHERAIDLAVAIAELRAAGEAQTQDVDVRKFRKSSA